MISLIRLVIRYIYRAAGNLEGNPRFANQSDVCLTKKYILDSLSFKERIQRYIARQPSLRGFSCFKAIALLIVVLAIIKVLTL